MKQYVMIHYLNSNMLHYHDLLTNNLVLPKIVTFIKNCNVFLLLLLFKLHFKTSLSKNFWSDLLIGKESVEKCHIAFGSYVTVEMKGQVHCIVGYRISHSVLCCMQLHILANVAL